MRRLLTIISRRLHLLLWRMTGRANAYIDMQIASSHNTRENKTVQANIKIALDQIYSLLKSKDVKILDAGCGDGWTMDQIRSAGYTNLWGIDINEEKLQIANDHKHVNVAKMLLPDLDFKDDFFDVIFCRHVYEHLLYPQKSLATFLRILKPGGVLFLIAPKSEINADSNESHVVKILKSDDIANLMELVGFTVVEQEEHVLEELEFWLLAKKDKKC